MITKKNIHKIGYYMFALGVLIFGISTLASNTTHDAQKLSTSITAIRNECEVYERRINVRKDDCCTTCDTVHICAIQTSMGSDFSNVADIFFAGNTDLDKGCSVTTKYGFENTCILSQNKPDGIRDVIAGQDVNQLYSSSHDDLVLWTNEFIYKNNADYINGIFENVGSLNDCSQPIAILNNSLNSIQTGIGFQIKTGVEAGTMNYGTVKVWYKNPETNKIYVTTISDQNTDYNSCIELTPPT